MTVAGDQVLDVNDVNVQLKHAKILQNISFTASTGRILAILGPTGSGKTTLLNAISGRQSLVSGHVTLNQRRVDKQLRRKFGFVLQQDVFFSNLTLWETLYFTAMIRVPEKVSHREKLSIMNEIVDILALRDCLYTVIGDMFTKGLSGGEKKRASIACELLTDPDILLIDEPTSGLDSSTALSLMTRIKVLVSNRNKMVLVTIHQPSSRIYYMFDSLLLLAHGQAAYFGKAYEEPIEFFGQFGHVCEPHFNPADFYLEILKSERSALDKFFIAQRKRTLEEENVKTAQHRNGIVKNAICESSELRTEVAIFTTSASSDALVNFEDISMDFQATKARERWNTSFFTQFKMLTWRNFKQSRGSFLHRYDMIFYAIIAIMESVLFFRIDYNEHTVRDVMGLFLFFVTFWVLEASNQALLAFPAERGVIAKERSAGAYRLSAYYFAKTVSELPLQIIMPTIFYSFIFWLTGAGGVSEYFITLPLLLLNTITAQGQGLFIACSISDIKTAFLSNTAIVLIGILYSGYVTQTFPKWLTWGKYISILTYPVSAMTTTLYKDIEDLPCNSTSVKSLPQCLRNETVYVTPSDVLTSVGIDLPIYCYVSMTVILCISFRVGAYLALRCRPVGLS